jgi:hypothetical protein
VKIINNETNAVLRGLTITNGQGEISFQCGGGGISIYSETNIQTICSISNCVIKDNYGNGAAGILAYNSNVNLSGTSIHDNHAVIAGGAIGLVDNSEIIFDSANRCNMYNNFAAYMCEIYISSIHISELTVIVDTFTVFEPNEYFVSNTIITQINYEFNILNGYLEPVDHDLYVSPDGDDNNSGLTPDEPLKTINLAVRNIASNSENPKTIHLASGIYNTSNNPFQLPFGCKAYVNIVGENPDLTLIDNEMNTSSLFWGFTGYKHSIIKNLTFKNTIFTSSPC